MAYIKYKNIHFRKLLNDISSEFFQKYVDEFLLLLNTHCYLTSFSKDEFINYVENLKHRNLPYDYKFEIIKETEKINCSIQVRLNQIFYLEGGIISDDVKIKNIREIANDLVDRRLADQAEFAVEKTPVRSSFNPLKRFFSSKDWFVYGHFFKIYLWHKLTKIFPLYGNVSNQNSSHLFEELVIYLNNIFSANLPQITADSNLFIELALNHSEFDEYSNYVIRCDNLLKEQISSDDFSRILQALSINAEQWFNETI